ncbi:MAG TPA: helix-turn-helix domain-containing protein [Candidatus Companilactobacillus pullicola]|uniref:Helix-turn-helix domain-containing protein n=1 Tax=Candidatus Companilactobacillus pullicola TaxID=2838523 RepID=A0A9D1ZKX0_9LACO|nr:helix-turn-helix domain-containing protein [Candidatus Companilactobacillus pullicola]
MLHRENKIKEYHTTSAADMIKEAIEYHRLTRAELANKLNVSQKTVDEILNRKKYLDKSLALEVEKTLGISSKLLLSLDENYCSHSSKKESSVQQDNQTTIWDDLDAELSGQEIDQIHQDAIRDLEYDPQNVKPVGKEKWWNNDD